MTYFSIFYHGNSEDVGVHGFIDFEWAREIDNRKLTSGYVFIFFGGAVNQMRKKQSMVSFSSTKVELLQLLMQVKKQHDCNDYAQKLGLNSKLLGWNVIFKVQSPQKGTQHIIQRQSILMYNIIFQRDGTK